MISASAVRLLGGRKVERVERKLVAAEGEVIVKTFQASICDADLRAYRGLEMPADLPSFEWLGHEGGGEVVEIGPGVREFRVGDMVMCFGPNNSWATHFKANARTLFKMPSGMDPAVACLGEPTAVGLFGVFDSGMQLGDNVLVAGLNYQGLLAVEAFKKRGAKRVIALDYDERHLEMAKQRGADIALLSTSGIEPSAIKDLTDGRGADVAFHSCGYWNPNAEAFYNFCAYAVRDEGVLASIPDMMSPITAHLHRLHHHAIDVRFPAVMHHGYEFLARWVPRLLRVVADGFVDVRSLITAEYPLSRIEDAISAFDADPGQVKIAVKP